MKLLKNWTVLFFSSLMFLPVLASAEDVVPFKEPDAVGFSRKARYSEEEIKSAILAAARQNQWQVVSETPGSIQLKIQGPNDGTELVMDAHYNSRKFRLRYVSSEGLQYQKESSPVIAGNNSNANFVSKNFDAGPSISRQYEDWVKQLMRSIKRQVRSGGDF